MVLVPSGQQGQGSSPAGMGIPSQGISEVESAATGAEAMAGTANRSWAATTRNATGLVSRRTVPTITREAEHTGAPKIDATHVLHPNSVIH